MSDTPNSPSRLLLERLIPEHLSHILHERPLLWFEDKEQYDALLAELIGEYDPKGMVEFILVKDLADAQWEVMRLRQLRQAAVDAEFTDAAWALMKDDFQAATGQQYYQAKDLFRVMTRKAVQGHAETLSAFDHYAAEAGVTRRMIQYEALKIGLKSIGALEENLGRAERRRDQLIRMIEDRRRNLAAMSRSLVDRSGATPAIEAPATDEAA